MCSSTAHMWTILLQILLTRKVLWLKSKIHHSARIASVALLTFSVSNVQSVSADEHRKTKLNAKPDSCVALHRGQNCVMKVKLIWSQVAAADVCLYVDDEKLAIACFSPQSVSTSVNYSSKTSRRYSLRMKGDSTVVSEVLVTTAWVYRTGRRSSSSWRLF